jgi:hypothetical protein
MSRSRTQALKWASVLLALVALAAACTDRPAPLAPEGLVPAAPRRLLVPGAGYTGVSAGYYHACALVSGGTVACWGRNDFGQSSVPAGITSVIQIDAGAYHTCALISGGTVTCWGRNSHGQSTPPAGLTGVTQVSAGLFHTCALTAGGAVTCWGDNSFYGQLAVPAALTGVTQTQIAAGETHTCAVAAGGTVACWGRNLEGQSTPPAGLTGVTKVSAGAFHTCALVSSGSVICWGNNDTGQLTVPAGLTGVVQIDAGPYHTCAVVAGGTVTCWGYNVDDFLSVPAGLAGVTQVSGGAFHTCARALGGTVTCWGLNNLGQTTVPAPPPVQVLPTADFSATPAAVIAGQSFTLTLTNAQVPGYTSAFTYAFDCGSGYAAPSATASANCPTSTAGGRTVHGKVIDQEGDFAEYQASVDVKFVQQAIAFTSAPPSPAYVGATYDPSATGGGSGNAVTFASQTPLTCSVAAGTVTFMAAGLCTVAADQAGNTTYSAALQQTQGITIEVRPQAPQSITFAALGNKLVGAAPFNVSATASSGLPVSFASLTTAVCTVSGTTVTMSGVGLCTIRATQGGDASWLAATPVDRSFIVGYGVSALSPPAKGTFQRGSTIPVKFQLTDAGGAPIPSSVAASLGCTVTVTFNAGTPVCAVYNAAATMFQADIKTPASLTKGGSYQIVVNVLVGATAVATAVVTVVAK